MDEIVTMHRNTGSQEQPVWEKWYPLTKDDAVVMTDESTEDTQQQTVTLKQKIAELKQELATIESQVAELNGDVTQLNSDMSKIVFGTYTGKPEDGIIEIPAPGIQPNSAIAVNGDYAAANSTYVLGVRTPSDNNVLQVMVEGTSGTMRINYIYKKS